MVTYLISIVLVNFVITSTEFTFHIYLNNTICGVGHDTQKKVS